MRFKMNSATARRKRIAQFFLFVINNHIQILIKNKLKRSALILQNLFQLYL